MKNKINNLLKQNNCRLVNCFVFPDCTSSVEELETELYNTLDRFFKEKPEPSNGKTL